MSKKRNARSQRESNNYSTQETNEKIVDGSLEW
jgi:hypothetical protein